MGGEWRTYSIGDIFFLENGFAFKSNEFDAVGTPVIKIKNVKAGHFSSHEFSYISPAYIDKKPAKVARNGDLLISMTGNRHDGSPDTWVGKVALFKSPEPHLINQRVGALRLKDPSKFDVRYLAYLLASWRFQTHFISVATSSGGQANLSPDQILSESIECPVEPVQRAVAEILGSLDDKIELNRQTNETLEAMAQALFKSWFVDFDPVIDNALAAGNEIPEPLQARAAARRALGDARKPLPEEIRREFPDGFEFRDEMGWVPRGWGVTPLSGIAELVTDAVKPFEYPDQRWEHFSIPSFDKGKTAQIDAGESIKSNKYKVVPDSILVSKLNPETERVWWVAPTDPSAAICSTEFMQFVSLDSKNRPFLYYLVRSQPFQEQILLRVTGSTGSRQRAQPSAVHSIHVADVSDSLKLRFSRMTLAACEQITANVLQGNFLAQTRDTLLPKLLSGELTIPDAEKLAADVL